LSRFVLVTRSEESIGELKDALAPHGIEVAAFPVLRDAPADDPAGWGAVATASDSLRFVALTSARAPVPFRRAAEARGLWPRLSRLPVAAVGPASARAAAEAGMSVTMTADAGAASLAAELAARLTPGATVLHPCGRDRRSELAQGLAGAGAGVLSVVVYAMEPTPFDELPALPTRPPLAVLLSSPRAARAYLAVCRACFHDVPHFAMGATTAAAARELGLEVVALTRPTPDALVEELCLICS